MFSIRFLAFRFAVFLIHSCRPHLSLSLLFMVCVSKAASTYPEPTPVRSCHLLAGLLRDLCQNPLDVHQGKEQDLENYRAQCSIRGTCNFHIKMQLCYFSICLNMSEVIQPGPVTLLLCAVWRTSWLWHLVFLLFITFQYTWSDLRALSSTGLRVLFHQFHESRCEPQCH